MGRIRDESSDRSLPAAFVAVAERTGDTVWIPQHVKGTCCGTAFSSKRLLVIFVLLKKELDYWSLEDRLYNRKLRALDAAA